jgi:hypothetical protein
VSSVNIYRSTSTKTARSVQSAKKCRSFNARKKSLSQLLLGYAEALMNFVQRCLSSSTENVFWSRDVRNVNLFHRTLLIYRLCRIICHLVRIFLQNCTWYIVFRLHSCYAI